MDRLLAFLEQSYQFDKKHNLFLSLIESLAGIIAGGFFGTFFSNHNYKYLFAALLFSFIFIYLAYRRLSKDTNFSISALGELKSTILLDSEIRENERKTLIYAYIDDAVNSLNSNTCSYNDFNAENHLCDESITNGLKSVYRPYFENLQNLLNTSKAKFTVGAYLNWFFKMPEAPITTYPSPSQDIFIPKDDLGFSDYFASNLLTNPDLRDLSFYFQTQCLDTFKHERFIHAPFSFSDRTFWFITAPISTVCEDAAIGVFFMICEELHTLPNDLENVTKIFSRLFSNWLNKYNECITSRITKIISVGTPPEVLALDANSNGD